MSTLYEDKYLVCDDDALTIKDYFFPFGSKRIPYQEIRKIKIKELSAFSGRFRVWGMDLEPYWYHLDWHRPRKKWGIVIDMGHWIQPVLTPQDHEVVLALLKEKSKVRPKMV